MTAARLAPVNPPYPDDLQRTLARLMGGAGVEPLKLFRTIAHNAALLDKLRSTGSYLLNFGALDPQEREVVILRTCARCGSEYEWGVHVAIYAAAVGLSDAQVRATAVGNADDVAWSPRHAALVRLVDELHDTGGVSDGLWGELRASWSAEQLVELVTLVGQYHMVSFCTQAFQVELEDYGARFPR